MIELHGSPNMLGNLLAFNLGPRRRGDTVDGAVLEDRGEMFPDHRRDRID